MGNWLLKVLIVEYVIIATAYFWSGDWARGMYFVGAVILSAGVLFMR